MTDRQFRALLNLVMCSDPTPVDVDDDEAIVALIDSESRARGFDGWVAAYHEFEPA